MKRILVLGAGGSPATNFVRSLRSAPDDVYLVGADADAHTLMRAETDVAHLVPRADDPSYIPVLNDIAAEEGVELVHAQNDLEIAALSAHRDELTARTFLPAADVVSLCQDKFASYCRWQDAGLRVPETMLIANERNLADAFERFGDGVWLRAASGAGGRGALAAHDIETARHWLSFNDGWGTFTAGELLTPRSVTWMSIWYEGELVVAQGRERLYWELARISPAGITGVTGAGVTISDSGLDAIAKASVAAVDDRPHGLYGVDLTYDRSGIPNPTEINIGRFFTTHHFFTALGLNMPWIFVCLAYGEPTPAMERKLNPLRDGMVWIRGVDFEPVLVPQSQIDEATRSLAERRGRLSK